MLMYTKEIDYPVKIYCPLIDAETTVYFHPKQVGGTYTLHIDSFNGCDDHFQGRPECDACKEAAFEIARNRANQ